MRHDIDSTCFGQFSCLGVGLDCVSNMVFSVSGYSRPIFSPDIEFVAYLLVFFFCERWANYSDLRSKTGLVLLELPEKYGETSVFASANVIRECHPNWSK